MADTAQDLLDQATSRKTEQAARLADIKAQAREARRIAKLPDRIAKNYETGR